ncbi:MAG: DNA helicase RecQ [Candidatus Promineifilaceae bacterium]|nr:DNA helicase RecQ [Candidatus Promineifilaceae bacterium]
MDDARRLLKQTFGFDEFWPLQEEVVGNVLDKRDTLAVMPTGSGKSLCYQLPALLFSGLTVVVSPLISLMQDQVDQLQAAGIAAVSLNSTLDYPTYTRNVARIRNREVRLLYVAPETLLRPETLVLLERLAVDCLTIDEAHCISEWGHDFRPEYRQLVDVRRRLPDAVCLAVTATATEHVRRDIKQSLQITDADEFLASFDRKNLFLAVQTKTNGLAQTLAFLEQHREQSGIIYCATRRRVDELAEALAAHGWQALPYHAGLDDEVRRRHQRRFVHDEVPIMVATIAFGMGIDKSNVRFIVHYDLPKNLESYYQQIGRAGRDGLRADCLLLYSYGDVATIEYFIRQQEREQQREARVRLEALLGFAETGFCRRRSLLAYFGETYAAESCEMCDNCLVEEKELEDLTVPAQKFLSCVKRTGEMFGANHIIKVLRGSRAKRVLKQGHDKLSTYGIGREFSADEWKYLANQFVELGLLTRDVQYGSLKLTGKATDVFRGERVYGLLPDAAGPAGAVSAGEDDHDAALFKLLRDKRMELAEGEGVPPYVVFSDRSLVEMATTFPRSRASFARIHGVGEYKLEKYAEAFLPVIQAYCETNGIAEKAKPKARRHRRRSSSGRGTRRKRVVRAYNDGQSIAKIAQEVGVKEQTVLNHLWRAAEEGGALRADGFLKLSRVDAGMRDRVLNAFAEEGVVYLRPVYDALEGAVDYDELRVLRLYFVSREQAEADEAS